ncbi:MAG: NAD-dependent epimerase/dehydratase family protein [Bacteroidota bacterium]
MSKRYLVTGGTGFIGSALVRRLLQAGYTVRVLDNNLRGAPRRLEGVTDQVEMVEADIRDAEAVKAACEGVDAIAHLAYLNGTEFFYSKPELVLDIGVKGMVNILDAAIHHNIREFYLASSSETYQTPPIVPTPEEVPLIVPDVMNPRYSYGGGKIICELMAVNYGRKHFDRMLIFRPHNVYGPDMGWEHVLPQFALRMHKVIEEAGEADAIDFPIMGTGEETRAFIYIDDFTEGLFTVMEKGEHNNVYHIGTMEEISISQLAQAVGDYFGKQVNIQPGKAPEGATYRRCPDIEKLRKLGFEPAISLEEGVARTAQWYVANRDKAPQKD